MCSTDGANAERVCSEKSASSAGYHAVPTGSVWRAGRIWTTGVAGYDSAGGNANPIVSADAKYIVVYVYRLPEHRFLTGKLHAESIGSMFWLWTIRTHATVLPE